MALKMVFRNGQLVPVDDGASFSYYGAKIPASNQNTKPVTSVTPASKTVPYYGAKIPNPTYKAPTTPVPEVIKEPVKKRNLADDYQALLKFGQSPDYNKQSTYNPVIDTNPKPGVVPPPATTGGGSGGGGTGGTGTDTTKAKGDYTDAVNKYKTGYSQALAKYDLQVQQQLEGLTETGRDAYVNRMMAERVRGNVMAQSGFGAGYGNIMARNTMAEYNQAYNRAVRGYNQNVDTINQNVSDLAYDYNQNLADLYASNKDTIAGITKGSVTKKTYAKR